MKILKFLDKSMILIINIIVLLTMIMYFKSYNTIKVVKNMLFMVTIVVYTLKIVLSVSIKTEKKFSFKIPLMDAYLLVMIFFICLSLVVNSTTGIIAIYNSLMCFIVYFYFKRINNTNFNFNKWIVLEELFSIVFLILYLFLFFTNTIYLSGQRTTVGLVLPFIVLSVQYSKTNKISFALIGLFVFSTLASMNRTFLLVALLCLIFKIFASSNKLWVPILCVVACIMLYIGYEYILTNYSIDILNKSLNGDYSSGRLSIYSNMNTLIKNMNIIDFIFGKGFNGVANELKIGAHSDFYEILYDFGVVSLLAYILFIIKMMRENKKLEYSNYLFVLILVVYGFSNNMLFSTGFSIPLFMTIGMICNQAINSKMSMKYKNYYMEKSVVSDGK